MAKRANLKLCADYERPEGVKCSRGRISWATFIFEKDHLIALSIFVVSLLYAGSGIFSLEFVRNTEADRTLIGWEMAKRNNFLVPYLLGDPYPTKPPGYYWILALTFKAFGDYAEWIARLPSVVFAAMLLSVFFLFLRRAGIRKGAALVAVCILATSGEFFRISVVAEIDMAYAALSGVAMFIGYFTLIRPEALRLVIFTYLFLSLAFLVKGPLVLVFYAAGFVPAFLYAFWGKDYHERALFIRRSLGSHFWGVVLFCVVVGTWAFLFVNKFGLEESYLLFKQELLERFTGAKGSRPKPWYFYIYNIAGGLLPWSFLLVGFLIPRVTYRGLEADKVIWEGGVKHRNLLCVYAGFAVLCSVFILSLSAGKAGRYPFPLYPFLAFWLLLAGARLYFSRFRKYLLVFVGGLSFCALLAYIALPFIFGEFVPSYAKVLLPLLGVCLFSPLIYFCFFSRRDDLGAVLVLFVVSLLFVRAPYVWIYCPYQNSVRNYKHVAFEIDSLVPEGEVIYILELPERWIAYYLTRLGRTVLRLTPAEALKLKSASIDDYIYIVIGYRDESWRLSHMNSFDPESFLIKEFRVKGRGFGLLRTRATLAHNFKPQKLFPNRLTRPADLGILPPPH